MHSVAAAKLTVPRAVNSDPVKVSLSSIEMSSVNLKPSFSFRSSLSGGINPLRVVPSTGI